jgi:hypothetical protein
MRTVAHLFDTYDTATQVVQALEAAGFAHDDVSIVANQTVLPGAAYPATTANPAVVDDAPATDAEPGTGAATGASVGTLLGGGAGLLAGIGAMAIPGVGPVVAAGWLVATLTGAGAGAGLGGLFGALTGSGVHDEHAHVYAEGVRRGGTLVTVRVSEAAESERAPQAESIMRSFHPVDVSERQAAYRADDGWTGFDETRTGLTPEQIQDERMRSTPPIV